MGFARRFWVQGKPWEAKRPAPPEKSEGDCILGIAKTKRERKILYVSGIPKLSCSIYGYNQGMAHIQLLYSLQQLDDEIRRNAARLDEIHRLLANDEAVRKAKIRALKGKALLKRTKQELSNIETEVQAQQIKLEQNQNTLYGGKVQNPRELQDLQREAEAVQRRIAQLEEKQLQAMETVEKAERNYKKLLHAYHQAQAQQSENQAGLQGEHQRLAARQADLKVQREEKIRRLPEDERRLYEDLQDTRQGVAVASVSNGACSACGATLSTRLMQDARSPNRLARCTNCQRILYDPS